LLNQLLVSHNYTYQKRAQSPNPKQNSPFPSMEITRHAPLAARQSDEPVLFDRSLGPVNDLQTAVPFDLHPPVVHQPPIARRTASVVGEPVRLGVLVVS